MMFCGRRSLRSVAAEDQWSPKSPSPKVLKEKKKATAPAAAAAAAAANPYSKLGLDKFSTLLADLEARRARIKAKAGPAAAVWFTYSDSNECVPVIVRLKDRKEDEARQPENGLAPQPESPSAAAEPAGKDDVLEHDSLLGPAAKQVDAVILKKRVSWRKRRPRQYLSLALVLLLCCLLMFGRVFAIFCTSVWWYLVPLMRGEDEKIEKGRNYVRKKDHGRRRVDQVRL